MVQERPVRVERKLAAILAADVAGYSRLMHHDEEGTHANLTALLAEIVEPSIAEYGGRIVKKTGDGFLAEFPSAVEAVRAALQFQVRVRDFAIGESEHKRIAFRIGINIGDIIVEPHDIFGDGVNIAARLEGIAEPGGICVSASAYDQVRGKIGVEFADLGEQVLKNIALPVRAYGLGPDGYRPIAHSDGKPSISSLAPRLSIVVLPFSNIGSDPEQGHFVDGVTESLTTDLSRIRGSFVIARNTAFTFKGKAVDVKKVGHELSVRYVLEGSVQRGGNRLRINVQLIDAQSGNHIWAERFDKAVADLFDMQDEIVSRLANTLDAQLVAAEARRARRSPNPDAMDMHFQGMACLHEGLTTQHLTQARAYFERALALDPASVEARVGTAIVDFNRGAIFGADGRAVPLAAAEMALIKALSMAPQYAEAHMYLGAVHIFTERVAQGVVECEQALSLDRNLANAHGWIGMAKYILCRAAETETHILEALRLSPRDVFAHRWMMWAGMARVHLDANAEAVAWLRRSIEANRNFPLAHFNLAAALALLGSIDEARMAAQVGLALDPGFTLRHFQLRSPTKDPDYLARRERFYQGMRLAGVPEM
ncbi:adenylate/guanylate cyclase domain-containing protein [Bradyrhizobium sp.]|uniref:adenylate/guanylate cyclase domain-containing protein n=1 Tax=Bradyrhizobium sp. TaxID=376 RepID=UPI002C905CD8|nr:adenylate/guanylate cyclase domain-containing protein [Bradyrhizobium sp.]HMM88628.1 adenylate/guanylate cyclase domain-containing protein [Bradyrhizobium sp.]